MPLKECKISYENIKSHSFEQYLHIHNTRGPLVLYQSLVCIGYAELEQAWKHMTICCISFHPRRSIRKQIWPCHKKCSMSTQCHHLNKFGCTWVPDGVYQVSRSSASWFWRWFLKVFTIYGPGRHLSHVTRNIWTHFHPNITWRRHMKFGFKRPRVFVFI